MSLLRGLFIGLIFINIQNSSQQLAVQDQIPKISLKDLQNNLNFKDVDDIDEPKIAHPPAVGAYSDLKFEDDDDDLPAFKHGQDLPEYACAYCGIHDPASVVIIKNFTDFLLNVYHVLNCQKRLWKIFRKENYEL